MPHRFGAGEYRASVYLSLKYDIFISLVWRRISRRIRGASDRPASIP